MKLVAIEFFIDDSIDDELIKNETLALAESTMDRFPDAVRGFHLEGLFDDPQLVDNAYLKNAAKDIQAYLALIGVDADVDTLRQLAENFTGLTYVSTESEDEAPEDEDEPQSEPEDAEQTGQALVGKRVIADGPSLPNWMRQGHGEIIEYDHTESFPYLVQFDNTFGGRYSLSELTIVE